MTTIGSTATPSPGTRGLLNPDYSVGRPATVPGDGTIDKITVPIDFIGLGVGATQHLRCSVYAEASLDPSSLLGTSADQLVTSDSASDTLTFNDIDFPISPPAPVTAGPVWLVIHDGPSSAGPFAIAQDAGGDRGVFTADTYSDGPNDPYGPASNAGTSYIITAEFTPAADDITIGSSATPSPGGRTPLNSDYSVARPANVPSAGTISKLTAAIDYVGAGVGATQHLRGSVYAEASLDPASLLGTSADITVTSNSSTDTLTFVDIDFPLTTPVHFSSSQPVWLAIHDGAASVAVFALAQDASGDRGVYTADTFSDGPNDPYGPASNAGISFIITATFTPDPGSGGGGGSGPDSGSDSTDISSNVALEGSAQYVSDPRDLGSTGQSYEVDVLAQPVGATGTVSIEDSDDGVTFATADATVATTTSGSSQVATVTRTVRRYVRVRYVNGSTAQTSFVLDGTLSGTPDTTPPAAPTGLTATPGDTQVVLDWNDSIESDLNATPYLIERKTGVGGTYVQIATSTVSNYTDTGRTNGTTYYYRIRAQDNASTPNISSYSSEVSATPTATVDTTPPAAPTGLVLTPVINGISLDWNNNVESDLHATPYLIERRVSGGTFAQIAAVSSSAYADSSLLAGTTYEYRIRARDTTGNLSVYSSIVSAVPLAPAPDVEPPPPPNHVGADPGNGFVLVHWTRVSVPDLNAIPYIIERRVGSGSWTQIATVAGLSYIDNTVVAGTTYEYRVKVRDNAP